jgi:hypothetical protein
MLPIQHHENHISEDQIVLPLASFEGMDIEEGNDDISKVLELSNTPAHSIVVIDSNYSAAEERLESMEHLHVALVLNDRQLRKHLDTQGHLGMTSDAYMKASFAIRETNDPLGVEIHHQPRPERQVSEGSRH